MKAVVHGCLAGIVALSISIAVQAQESKSALVAQQLAAALDAGKLDSIAAKDPANRDVYVGALYLPGVELLVVSAKYSAPTLLDAKLANKAYRDVYMDLNTASVLASRVWIEDLGADGVKAKREENRGFDTCEIAGKRTMFDSDWKKQQLTEAEYLKVFSDARRALQADAGGAACHAQERLVVVYRYRPSAFSPAFSVCVTSGSSSSGESS